MKISADNAINHFFSTPSFEMIYAEAVANSLDAGATEIDISISISALSNTDSLSLIIRDNGIGFNDENFRRFSFLMDNRDAMHKGLGRLIYLKYFSSVFVESIYDNYHKRSFRFGDEINDLNVSESSYSNNFSKLVFEKFRACKLNSYDNVVPEKIKSLLLERFTPTFFNLKEQDIPFRITISLNDVIEEKPDKGFVTSSVFLDSSDLPKFKTKEFLAPELDIFDKKCKLLYYIDLDSYQCCFNTFLSADGRSIPFKLFPEVQLPARVSATFILFSDYLNSRSDDSRQSIVLDDRDKKIFTNMLIEQINEILDVEVPAIKDKNEEIKASLNETFPHLIGYFANKTIGIINRNKAILEAQEAFLRDEKDVLEANSLSDEQYHKSLSFASRTLAHYILYRNKIISNLEAIVADEEKEECIHNLFLPKKISLCSSDLSSSLYFNNTWILDDKFMSFQFALSDIELSKLIENIKADGETVDNLRPDIAFVFSDNINSNNPVDAVVVELKRSNVDYLANANIIQQIRQRARNLVSFYPDKIRRVWFFGIITFDESMLTLMHEETWIPIFSKDYAFYKELYVSPNNNKDSLIPVPVTLISFDAICSDAKSRNSVFLKILRNSIISDSSLN